MALTLRYNSDTSIPVEIEGIVPDRLRDKSLAEIERLAIHHGNRKVPLAELFTRLGRPFRRANRYRRGPERRSLIGYGMNSGEIRVHGQRGPPRRAAR